MPTLYLPATPTEPQRVVELDGEDQAAQMLALVAENRAANMPALPPGSAVHAVSEDGGTPGAIDAAGGPSGRPGA